MLKDMKYTVVEGACHKCTKGRSQHKIHHDVPFQRHSAILLVTVHQQVSSFRCPPRRLRCLQGLPSTPHWDILHETKHTWAFAQAEEKTEAMTNEICPGHKLSWKLNGVYNSTALWQILISLAKTWVDA